MGWRLLGISVSERKPRLFVLPPSHYCERARWALNHISCSYDEVRWPVGLHVPLAKRFAPRTTLPILDTGTEILQGSDRILDWTGMPGAEPDVERRFGKQIGKLVRQYIYSAILNDRRSGVVDVMFEGVPTGQALLGRLLWPMTRRLIVARMNARPELLPTLEREVEAELDWFDGCLGGRDHLVANSFGRADLTAASLLAPLARPVACPLYRHPKLPEAVEEALARWSTRPSLRWVERIYAEHRHPGPAPDGRNGDTAGLQP
jgi:glutathione S-transferase